MKIFSYKVINSTNSKAKDFIKKREKLPFCIVSEKLLQAVGRNNVRYFTPKGGLWFTLADKFNKEISSRYSLLAGYAMILALHDYGIKTQIKWPNDIYFNEKKICGILCKQEKNYILIGVGLNTNIKRIPQIIKESASSIYKETQLKTNNIKILKLFIKHYLSLLKNPTQIIEKVNKLLIWKNKTVSINVLNKIEVGIFKGIDENGYAIIGEKCYVDGHLRGEL